MRKNVPLYWPAPPFCSCRNINLPVGSGHWGGRRANEGNITTAENEWSKVRYCKWAAMGLCVPTIPNFPQSNLPSTFSRWHPHPMPVYSYGTERHSKRQEPKKRKVSGFKFSFYWRKEKKKEKNRFFVCLFVSKWTLFVLSVCLNVLRQHLCIPNISRYIGGSVFPSFSLCLPGRGSLEQIWVQKQGKVTEKKKKKKKKKRMRPSRPLQGPCWVYLCNSQWNDLHSSCWSVFLTPSTLSLEMGRADFGGGSFLQCLSHSLGCTGAPPWRAERRKPHLTSPPKP